MNCAEGGQKYCRKGVNSCVALQQGILDAIGSAPWALKPLAQDLAQASRTALQDLWREIYVALQPYSRSELIERLAGLAPIIRVLGGDSAIGKMTREMARVSRWWP